jgi:16S rRNA (adenine1518-N6/adenine1519-N6)-dimethyltransferase
MTTPAVPRTRAEIRAALRALGARPSKRLGQNFLADPAILDRVSAAAAAGEGDLVLEVGAGLGGLTERLSASGAAVAAVEVDAALASFLRGAFDGDPRVRLVEGDALDGRGGLSPAVSAALRREPPPSRLLVAANLPYSVATPLLRALLRREPPPDDLVIMVQREVADRIVAAPATGPYGPLSVLVQAVARARRLFPVPARAFHPVPAVASAVVRVTPDPARRSAAGDLDRLERVVHAGFGMRRKTLANALGKAGLGDAIARAGLDGGRRAETLSPAEFVLLAKAAG